MPVSHLRVSKDAIEKKLFTPVYEVDDCETSGHYTEMCFDDVEENYQIWKTNLN